MLHLDAFEKNIYEDMHFPGQHKFKFWPQDFLENRWNIGFYYTIICTAVEFLL